MDSTNQKLQLSNKITARQIYLRVLGSSLDISHHKLSTQNQPKLFSVYKIKQVYLRTTK